MKEIEVKILEIDRQVLEKRLITLGARSIFSGELHARFYDNPKQSITSNGEVLRIRREGEEVFLTFKAPISLQGAKIMEELEVGISEITPLLKIMRHLGFHVIKETQKWRDEYQLEDSKVVFDNYKGDLAHIPEFMEIEAPSLERLYEVLELLGIDKANALSWSTYDLVQHYSS
ncbi:MAG: class IV adenylate cyclase [Bacteroidota bacterium]